MKNQTIFELYTDNNKSICEAEIFLDEIIKQRRAKLLKKRK